MDGSVAESTLKAELHEYLALFRRHKLAHTLSFTALLVVTPLLLAAAASVHPARALTHPCPSLVVFATTWCITATHPPVPALAQLFRNKSDGLSALLILAGVVLTIFVNLFEFARAPKPPSSCATRAFVAILLLVFGTCLRVCSIRWLGRLFTGTVVDDDKTSEKGDSGWRLVDDGPYRFVRHPSYLGVLLAFVGFALLTGSSSGMILTVAFILPAYLYRIEREEAFLLCALPAAYSTYQQRTWRLLPFVF